MENNIAKKFAEKGDALALHREAYERRLHKLAQRKGGDSRGDQAPEIRPDGNVGKPAPTSAPTP